jgi:hypothetical protein
MDNNSDTHAAVRAAYRLGVLDVLLHEDVIGSLNPPALITASLTGERQARMNALESLGIDWREALEGVTL